MWVAKLRIKHDCTIGNRCEKFNVTSLSRSISHFEKGGKSYTYQMHHLVGKEEKVKAFIEDLKKDRRIKDIEIEKNTVFLLEVRRGKEIPSSYYTPEMFFVKPIFVDTNGYEFWEMASSSRAVLADFIVNLHKAEKDIDLKILKLSETKLSDVYFPRAMPELTDKQKKAIELAIEYGYYSVPRRINLKKLSRMMKVSLSTFQEHLRKAESRLMPDLLKEIE